MLESIFLVLGAILAFFAKGVLHTRLLYGQNKQPYPGLLPALYAGPIQYIFRGFLPIPVTGKVGSSVQKSMANAALTIFWLFFLFFSLLAMGADQVQ